MQQGIQSVGKNRVFIGSGSHGPGAARMGFGSVKTLTRDDMEAILREVPLIREAAPVVVNRAQVVYGNQNWSTGITGTTPNYFEIRNWPVQGGSGFRPEGVAS